jgi:hypothetical protein
MPGAAAKNAIPVFAALECSITLEYISPSAAVSSAASVLGKPASSAARFAANANNVHSVSMSEVVALNFVPLIFHSAARAEFFDGPFAALTLAQMLTRGGSCRFESEVQLRDHFLISANTQLVLSGTDNDPQLERWWKLGRTGRIDMARHLSAIGIKLVTTPNFSVFTDVPRWGDMHSMSRIAIAHWEMHEGGLPAALHVNGRTDYDFARWVAFLREHPEITHISYEFTTGTSRLPRRAFHVRQLLALREAVSRPLQLVVRGGSECLPLLAEKYERVSMLDTAPFMKAQKRQQAEPMGNDRVRWASSPTIGGEKIDRLFNENCTIRQQQIEMLAARALKNPGEMAAA